jgi:hypothetical protein
MGYKVRAWFSYMGIELVGYSELYLNFILTVIRSESSLERLPIQESQCPEVRFPSIPYDPWLTIYSYQAEYVRFHSYNKSVVLILFKLIAWSFHCTCCAWFLHLFQLLLTTNVVTSLSLA